MHTLYIMECMCSSLSLSLSLSLSIYIYNAGFLQKL